jgi:DNA-binding MarR family transcriptional regulator
MRTVTSTRRAQGDAAAVPEPIEADATTWALRSVLRGYAGANLAIGRQLGLSPNDLEAMEHLLAGDPELGPVELGNRLGIRSASATAMVDRLERAGHLQRGAHPTDRRRRTLTVTPAALESLFGVLGPLVRDLTVVAESLGDDDRQIVTRYLQDIGGVLSRYSDDPN